MLSHKPVNQLLKQLRMIGIGVIVVSMTACQTPATSIQNAELHPSAPLTDSVAIGEKQWELTGFEQPESVIYDPLHQQYLVSNISGMPTELNGNGFISRVSPDGILLEKHWVTGLNAPKGMAQRDHLLFIADMQQLHVVDTRTGDITQTLTAPNSQMLNDISIDTTGAVYISDLLGGGIYQLDSNNPPFELTQWIAPEALPHTNGVLVDGDELLVATWGKGMHEDFSTDVLGSLLEVNLHTKQIRPVVNAQQFGNLDGVVKVGDTLFVNDWINGKVFSYHNHQLTEVMQTEKTTADIGTDGKNLLLPVMMQNKVVSYGLAD